MPVLAKDLKWYLSAAPLEDDTVLNGGGAISTSKKPEFLNIPGAGQIVSSAADTTQTVTITYRSTSGSILTEVKTLNGTTAVVFTVAAIGRLLKAVKSATTTGDVAIEAQTATRSNTATAGAVDTVTLDAGASAVDNFYNGQAIRLTGGTGSGQIRSIIDYDGATKVASVSRDWGTNPDATSTFRIAPGAVLDKSPHEILEIRRPFPSAGADPQGGVTRDYHEKLFVKNTHATLDLLSATVKEISDPSGRVTFGVAATLNDTATLGASNNRQVAPAGITFDNADKATANSGVLTAGAAQSVWLRGTQAAAALSIEDIYLPDVVGNTA